MSLWASRPRSDNPRHVMSAFLQLSLQYVRWHDGTGTPSVLLLACMLACRCTGLSGPQAVTIESRILVPEVCLLALLAPHRILPMRIPNASQFPLASPAVPPTSLTAAAACSSCFHRILGRGASFLLKYSPHALHSGRPSFLSLRQKGVDLVPQFLHTCSQCTGREMGQQQCSTELTRHGHARAEQRQR